VHEIILGGLSGHGIFPAVYIPSGCLKVDGEFSYQAGLNIQTTVNGNSTHTIDNSTNVSASNFLQLSQGNNGCRIGGHLEEGIGGSCSIDVGNSTNWINAMTISTNEIEANLPIIPNAGINLSSSYVPSENQLGGVSAINVTGSSSMALTPNALGSLAFLGLSKGVYVVTACVKFGLQITDPNLTEVTIGTILITYSNSSTTQNQKNMNLIYYPTGTMFTSDFTTVMNLSCIVVIDDNYPNGLYLNTNNIVQENAVDLFTYMSENSFSAVRIA
jgi:hypothetical protein